MKVYTTFILSASITRGVTYAKLTHTVAEGRYTTVPHLFPAGCVAHPEKFVRQVAQKYKYNPHQRTEQNLSF